MVIFHFKRIKMLNVLKVLPNFLSNVSHGCGTHPMWVSHPCETFDKKKMRDSTYTTILPLYVHHMSFFFSLILSMCEITFKDKTLKLNIFSYHLTPLGLQSLLFFIS